MLDEIVILEDSLGTLTKYASKTTFHILKEYIIKLFTRKGLQQKFYFVSSYYLNFPFPLNAHI